MMNSVMTIVWQCVKFGKHNFIIISDLIKLIVLQYSVSQNKQQRYYLFITLANVAQFEK